MGEVSSKIQISVGTDFDYMILRMYAVKFFDTENHWPVEEYDPARRTIDIESVEADENEVLDFAKLLNFEIRTTANKVTNNPKLRDRLLAWSFVIVGATRHYNGEAVNYCRITRQNNRLYISENGGAEEDVRKHMRANTIYIVDSSVKESDELDPGGICLIPDGQLENLLYNQWPAEAYFSAFSEIIKGKNVKEVLSYLKIQVDNLRNAVASGNEVYKNHADDIVLGIILDAVRVGCAHNGKANDTEVRFISEAAALFNLNYETLIDSAKDDPEVKKLYMVGIRIANFLPTAFNSILGIIACCIYCDGLIEDKDKEYLAFLLPYLSGGTGEYKEELVNMSQKAFEIYKTLPDSEGDLYNWTFMKGTRAAGEGWSISIPGMASAL